MVTTNTFLLYLSVANPLNSQHWSEMINMSGTCMNRPCTCNIKHLSNVSAVAPQRLTITYYIIVYMSFIAVNNFDSVVLVTLVTPIESNLFVVSPAGGRADVPGSTGADPGNRRVLQGGS